MLGLVIIDMQKWMFRYPERAAQIDQLNRNISAISKEFELRFPIFDVQTIHKADRSTWSHLMRKYDYPCLIEGTDDIRRVDGYQLPERAIQITKTANSAFLGTNFETQLKAAGVTEIALAGVFIDGCVGLTAADAAQRGFEVVFIDDAIGHTRADRRPVILNWLTDDYELKTWNTEQAIAHARQLLS
jgi:nicotinamidase-related amidase